MPVMRRFSDILSVFLLAAIGWFFLQACSSMEGQAAPDLVVGEVVLGSQLAHTGPLATDGWRLLSFFGPN